jgi:aspartyl protease family protein
MRLLGFKQGMRFTVCALTLILAAFVTVAPLADDGDDRKFRRQISVQAILGSKVMLLIDGERTLMAQGDAPVAGVRVLRVTPEQVEVTVDGKPRKLVLGDHDTVTTPYKERESTVVIIPRNERGMYTTVGSINGLTVDFLVDTGATTIAMNSAHARRLGIDYRLKGEKMQVMTAAGMTHAYLVQLDTVSVGGITLRNVAAGVTDGQFPHQVLLGMSFLGRVEIQHEANVMRLQKKF